MKKLSIQKNRKGQVQYLMENAFRIGFLMVAMLIFFLLISLYVNNKVDAQRLQAETFKNRILYGDAINYNDENIGRIYPGIIDMKKLSSDLDDRIDYGPFTRNVAAKIKILNKPTNQIETGTLYKEAYFNKNQYLNWKPLIDGGKTGKGSATMFVSQLPATCYDNNQYRYCTLIIEVIVPNS